METGTAIDVAALESRITAARTRLCMAQPFWGALAYSLELVRDDAGRTGDTMATDGRRIFWFPPFVATLSDAELEGVLAHETYHCAAGHMTRRGRRDARLWNEAADYAINAHLTRGAGMTLPAGALLSDRFDGLAAEEIYSELARERENAERQEGDQEGDQEGAPGAAGDGATPQGDQEGEEGAPDGGTAPGGNAGDQEGDADASGAGSGGAGAQGDQDGAASGAGSDASGDQEGDAPGSGAAGDQDGAPQSDGAGSDTRDGQSGAAARGNDPGRCGGVLDGADTEGERQALESEWGARVRQAIASAKAAGAGRLPGGVAELVAAIDAPRVDWRAELRRFVDDKARTDSSFARPSRRFAGAPFVMPGQVPDGLSHLVAIVDTSGSISARELNAFAAELDSAFADGAADRLSVVFADTDVRHVQEFTRGDVVTLESKGGGGTDFAAAFEWVRENAPDASAVIYLTDLETSGFGSDPGAPVLFAVYGPARRFAELAPSVPFGDAVHISADW